MTIAIGWLITLIMSVSGLFFSAVFGNLSSQGNKDEAAWMALVLSVCCTATAFYVRAAQ